MAVMGRLSNSTLLTRNSSVITLQACKISSQSQAGPVLWKSKKFWYSACGLAAGGIGAVLLALENSVKAYDFPLHAPKQPWSHSGIWNAYDMASVRRGFEVYRNVCKTCHSIEFLPFRRMVDIFHTKEELEKIAAEFEVEDGPDETGAMFKRPGKLNDYIPNPYKNDEEAMAANNGATPPDLSLIALGREGEEDYIFSLLTGYCDREDIPAGVTVAENSYYNPYIHGSVLAMAPPLYNNIFEYEDGTPATRSQLAKDVANFLRWCAEPEQDKKKLWFLKFNFFSIILILCFGYSNRHRWLSLRTRSFIGKELKEQTPKK